MLPVWGRSTTWHPRKLGGRNRSSGELRTQTNEKLSPWQCDNPLPVGDQAGVIPQVIDRLTANRTWAFRRLPGASAAASGSVMSCCSPRSVIFAKEAEREQFAADCESLPIGRAYRSVDSPTSSCQSVTLRDLTWWWRRSGRGGGGGGGTSEVSADERCVSRLFRPSAHGVEIPSVEAALEDEVLPAGRRVVGATRLVDVADPLTHLLRLVRGVESGGVPQN